MKMLRLAKRGEPSKAALTWALSPAIAPPMQATRFLPTPLPSPKLLLAGALGLLAACADNSAMVPRAGTSPAPSHVAPPPQLHRNQPRALHIQNLPGLEGVTGATRPQLIRQFGAPRLDVFEGDVRKLQFSGSDCILDIYLYPPAPGQQPEASYVDARNPDGRDVDRAACVAALRQPVVK